MLPFKRILCPTDFSEFSLEALQTAITLAEQFSAELIVAHIVMPIPIVPVTIKGYEYSEFNITLYQEELIVQHRNLLNELITERIPSDIHVTPVVLVGNEADEIVKCAEVEKADLIVIATHGRTGIKRMFLGSVAENVMRHTVHPVLMIRSNK
ncbi:universal stress protein [bacterium]|nr:universal stress protein [bacterium]